MMPALVTPPLAIALVLYGFALILAVCAASITAMKALRDLRHRLDEPVRARFRDIPAAVALDAIPPPAPTGRRERRVVSGMVIDATFALRGDARARAVEWLETNGFVSAAIDRMEHRRWPGVRPGLALRLGRMGSALAAPALRAGLVDRNYRMRDASATALGRVATTGDVAALVDAFARRDVPRGVLSNALLQLRPEANDALIACLTNEDDAARAVVAQVLGLRRAVAAVPSLMTLIEDPTAAVRREAVLALAAIAADTAVEVDARPLVRLSDDPAAIVRSAAATSLGTILGDRAERVLSAMCRDEDYWVSHRAAESLCRLPSGARFGWAVLAGHDDTPAAVRARAACLEWLERTGGLEERIEGIMRRGDDAALLVTLAVLEEVGSRAWGDLYARASPTAGIPREQAAA